MPTLTDPARQLAEICQTLGTGARMSGDQYLAQVLEVEPWSRDFWEIVSYIVELTDQVREIVATLPLDEDIKNSAFANITQVSRAFSKEGLTNDWSHATGSFLTAQFVNPILMLSGQVRAKVSYPKFSDQEALEISDLVNELLTWLRDHQLSEQDFIRQSLIIGLEKLQLRLSKLSLLGWGCAVDSLRQVISAYIMLERGFPEEIDNPSARAMIQKVGIALKAVGTKVSSAKDIYETGEWILRLAGSLQIGNFAVSAVSGYIGGS
jgi:hypothetical protein